MEEQDPTQVPRPVVVYFGKLTDQDNDRLGHCQCFDGATLFPFLVPRLDEPEWLEALGADCLANHRAEGLKGVFERWEKPKMTKIFKFQAKTAMTDTIYRVTSKELFDSLEDELISTEDHHIQMMRIGQRHRDWNAFNGFLQMKMDVSKKRNSSQAQLQIKETDEAQVFGITADYCPALSSAVRLLVLVASKGEAEALRDRYSCLIEASEQQDLISDDGISEDKEIPTVEIPVSVPVSDKGFVNTESTPEQISIAQRLIEKARKALGGDQALESFSSIDFLIVGPRFISLRTQTASRLARKGLVNESKWSTALKLAEEKVVPHDSNNKVWKEFQNRLRSDRSTLFVIVDDECHFGPTLQGAHDDIVNFRSTPDDLEHPNLLILQVSATPQNCLTLSSRVPIDNILEWSYDTDDVLRDDFSSTQCNTSLYRSVDWFCESTLWRIAPITGDNAAGESGCPSIVFRDQANNEVGIKNLVSDLKHFSFASFDFENFSHVMTELFKKTPGLESVRMTKKDVQGQPILVLHIPSGLRLICNPFITDLLGFGDKGDLEIGCPFFESAEIVGKRTPELCNPYFNKHGVSPLANQHIRADQSVQHMIGERRLDTSKSSQKRKNSKQSDGIIDEQDGHILVADYIVSMAYFAYFRVKAGFGNSNIGDELRPEDGPVLADFPAEHVSIVQVQAMLKALKTIGLQKQENKGHRLSDFSDTLKFVMDDFLSEARGCLYACEEDGLSADEADVWVRITEAKLKDEKGSRESNSRLSWFTESDRVVKTLLEVDAPSDARSGRRKGFMAFVRIYGTDRANLGLG